MVQWLRSSAPASPGLSGPQPDHPKGQQSQRSAYRVIADRANVSQTVSMKSTLLLSACAGLSLLLAVPAFASRAPTVREREQITNAYPAYIRNAPVECVFMDIRISSRDAHYALVGAQPLNVTSNPKPRCLRYAHNGFDILKRQRGKWRHVFSGSVEPPCSLKVPRDLITCFP
jgi:hypothetical protein